MTNDAATSSRPPVSPALQFVLLLSPVVMTCFYLVYALTGWVIEGRDKLNWSIEAGGVAFWVGSSVVLYCLLVLLLARYKGAGSKHILVYSSVFHIAMALLLTLSIFLSIQS